MFILIGDQGTGDLDIRYMGQHVGIAQLPGEEHNVAGILALFVNERANPPAMLGRIV